MAGKCKDIKFVVDNQGCHICTSHACGDAGYPVLKRDGKFTRGHRYIYEQAFGPVPKGLVVRHTCDNRMCINLDHLLVGTRLDNYNDMINRGRDVKGDFKGSKNSQAKLNDQKVKEIRLLLEDGLSQRKIAEKYGVTSAVISYISTGICWAHVK